MHSYFFLARHRVGLIAFALALAGFGVAFSATVSATTDAVPCEAGASAVCYFGFEPAGARGQLHYYASRLPAASTGSAGSTGPSNALIVVHGHSRDANKTFDAALVAVKRAGRLGDTLIVAPLFQVNASGSAKCRTGGVPAAEPGDLVWSCSSWIDGGTSANGARLSSFKTLDALVIEVSLQWPQLHSVTIAGFSAGAQMVQHSIGFAAAPPTGIALRYVISDPGTWLYFDAFRPQPVDAAACPSINRWKYGTDALPAHLGRSAAQARAQYTAAEIHYLEGALDSGDAKGAYYKILDKSCGANAQGTYRLERGQAYAEYDRTLLAPVQQRELTVVPGCAHDVACVFPSPTARAALLGAPR